MFARKDSSSDFFIHQSHALSSPLALPQASLTSSALASAKLHRIKVSQNPATRRSAHVILSAMHADFFKKNLSCLLTACLSFFSLS